jgi:hypothetical protein
VLFGLVGRAKNKLCLQWKEGAQGANRAETQSMVLLSRAAAGDASFRLSDSRRVLPAKVRIGMLKIVALFCRLVFCQSVKSGLAALMLGVSLLPHLIGRRHALPTTF